MTIDEKNLTRIKASELFEWAWFYLKLDNGEFTLCQVDFFWYPTRKQFDEWKAMTKKYSQEGRLYFRRDKPGHNFADISPPPK
jgi:hypothetical protein